MLTRGDSPQMVNMVLYKFCNSWFCPKCSTPHALLYQRLHADWTLSLSAILGFVQSVRHMHYCNLADYEDRYSTFFLLFPFSHPTLLSLVTKPHRPSLSPSLHPLPSLSTIKSSPLTLPSTPFSVLVSVRKEKKKGRRFIDF